MDIRIGNYRLTSGAKDFTITEVKVNADKESKNIAKNMTQTLHIILRLNLLLTTS
jgi:hypothetical protein